MALSEEILTKFTKQESLDFNLNELFSEIKETLTVALEEIEIESKKFSADNAKIYLQGSFLNNVNVGNNAKIEVVIELNKTYEENLSELNYSIFSPRKKRTVKISPKYSLLTFKNDLYNKLTEIIPNRKITRTNHAISVEGNLSFEQTVEILPAFSFKKQNEKGEDVPCILVFEELSGNYTISYPALHTKNLNQKDEKTNGKTKEIIRLFKNLRDYMLDNGLQTNAPGYFIDCLVYNIPNSLFKNGSLNEILLKILNYLNNKNLNEMVCVHEQFEMFGSTFDQWELKNARNFINALIFVFNNIKE